MPLGFAVKVPGNGGIPSPDSRRHFNEPSLGVSLDRLDAILDHLDASDIRFYRMATSLAPYASHPDLPRFRDAPRRFADRLAEVRAKARAPGIRLTSHPGQHTVLNSESERVQQIGRAHA